MLTNRVLEDPEPQSEDPRLCICYDDAIDWCKRHRVTPARRDEAGRKGVKPSISLVLTFDGIRVECPMNPTIMKTRSSLTARRIATCYCVQVLAKRTGKL